MIIMTIVQCNPSQVTSKPKHPLESVKRITTYSESGPIEILNDSAFGLYDFPGSGTPGSPYLIDGYNITDSTTDLIYIENTTKYFRIINCYLNSANSVFNCTELVNVTHGTIANNIICNSAGPGISLLNSSLNTILNNTIHHCNAGIFLQNFSSNNTILNNRIHNSVGSSYLLGIGLLYSCYNTILNNTIHDCWNGGIAVAYSYNNTFVNNTIYNYYWWGILIQYSFNDTLSGNTIYNSTTFGIGLSDSNSTTLHSNTIYDCYSVISNGINLENSNNNTLYSNTVYDISHDGIYLGNSNNNTLYSNTVYNISNNGICLGDSNNNILYNNTSYDSSQNGINLENSSYNTLYSNTIFNSSRYGIYQYRSDNNIINYNIVYNHTDYGLYIEYTSDHNTVNWNNFLNNSYSFSGRAQALDRGTTNNISYNYWHDYIGTGTYSIDGDANNLDPFPQLNPIPPVVTIISPLAQYYGTDTISVMLSGYAFNYWYYIETVDSQNQTWTVNEERTLTDGTYTFHAYGNNTLGITTHTSVTFVIDTSAPTVDITSPIETTYRRNNVTLAYIISDGTVTIYINGVTNTSAILSGSIISNLSDGSHNITIVAVDQAGAIGKDTVIFTIDTTENNTTASTTSKISSFLGLFTLLLFSATMVVVIRKRKKI